MDLDDFFDDPEELWQLNIFSQDFSRHERESEIEKSNRDRSVYINRELIYSDRYINAIKSLGENRICTKKIIDSARVMLEHHHGDKYEDLYFII